MICGVCYGTHLALGIHQHPSLRSFARERTREIFVSCYRLSPEWHERERTIASALPDQTNNGETPVFLHPHCRDMPDCPAHRSALPAEGLAAHAPRHESVSHRR